MNISKYNDKYFEFLRTLLKKQNNGKENTVFSPFSLLMLLAIAADATSGKTKEEIEKVLCGDMDYDEVKETLSVIQKQLVKDSSLRFANAVIVKEDLKDSVVDGYENRLAGQFGGKLFAVKDMVSAVNDWVNEHTNGMIPEVADESMRAMLFTLINAISFEAAWEEEYQDEDVLNDDFTNADGTVSRVKMLRSYESTYLENNVFEGFAKPYKDADFSYVALLPKIKGAIIDKEIKGVIPSSFRINPKASVTVTMPEFSCAFDQDMTSVFEDLGIKTIFTDKADFSPLSTEWLKAQAIIHKARIEVDRKGTKAAAVSFMPMCAGAAPTLEKEFREIKLDRPFIYAIVHNETGLPVFVGTINHLKALTGDDLMTEEEIWVLEDDLCSQLLGMDYDGIFDFKRNTPEYSFYERIRCATVKHDGKELRKIATEVDEYMKQKDA